MCQRLWLLSCLLLLWLLPLAWLSATESPEPLQALSPVELLSLATECAEALTISNEMLERYEIEVTQLASLSILLQREATTLQRRYNDLSESLNRAERTVSELQTSSDALMRHVSAVEIQRTIWMISAGVLGSGLIAVLVYLAVAR